MRPLIVGAEGESPYGHPTFDNHGILRDIG